MYVFNLGGPGLLIRHGCQPSTPAVDRDLSWWACSARCWCRLRSVTRRRMGGTSATGVTVRALWSSRRSKGAVLVLVQAGLAFASHRWHRVVLPRHPSHRRGPRWRSRTGSRQQMLHPIQSHMTQRAKRRPSVLARRSASNPARTRRRDSTRGNRPATAPSPSNVSPRPFQDHDRAVGAARDVITGGVSGLEWDEAPASKGLLTDLLRVELRGDPVCQLVGRVGSGRAGRPSCSS
jgi:hypothetical protein